MKTNKRFLSELSTEELDKVLDRNEKLQQDLKWYTNESEHLFLDDQLSYLKVSISDYAISPYQPSYLSVSEPLDFVFDVRRLEEAMPVLSIHDDHYLETALNLAREVYTKGNYTNKSVLEFKHAVIDLRDVVLGNMIKQLEYADSREAIRDYFLELYIHENPKMYVEDDSYILKEDITISYDKI